MLGPLRVSEQGDEVTIRQGISRRLLIALLMRPGDVVSSSALMEILWGDELPQNPANALQIQISYLRRTLAAGAIDGSQPIGTRAGGYAADRTSPSTIFASSSVRLHRILLSSNCVSFNRANVRSEIWVLRSFVQSTGHRKAIRTNIQKSIISTP